MCGTHPRPRVFCGKLKEAEEHCRTFESFSLRPPVGVFTQTHSFVPNARIHHRKCQGRCREQSGVAASPVPKYRCLCILVPGMRATAVVGGRPPELNTTTWNNVEHASTLCTGEPESLPQPGPIFSSFPSGAGQPPPPLPGVHGGDRGVMQVKFVRSGSIYTLLTDGLYHEPTRAQD